jgi:hypothetical protein
VRTALALGFVLLALVLGALWWMSRTDARGGAEHPEQARPPTVEPAGVALAASRESTENQTGEREALPVETLEAGIVLEGRVIELPAGAAREGTPAAGVTVARAQGFEGLGYDEEEDEQPPGAKSGADGTFRLVLPDEEKRPLELELVVEGDERFRHASVKCRLEAGESRRSGLVLARYEHGALTGRTIDVGRQPVAGVEVVLLGWDEAGDEMVPQRTALSDEGGSFLFERTREVAELAARKPGYTLLEARRPAQREYGTWEPLEVVLCARGALRLLVEDPAGEPVPDVQVFVTVAAPERFASSDGWSSLRRPSGGITDATGTIVSNVWADQRLEVVLQRAVGEDSVHLLTFERVEGDRPVPSPERRGTPLFVEPDGERTVRVVLAERRRLRGRVLDADGAAFREPWVSARTLDRPRLDTGVFHQRQRADERGRFELDLVAQRPLGTVLVTANDTGPLSFVPGATPGKSAWAVVDVSAPLGPEDELTLVMRATGAIGGRIVCDPPPVGVQVRAHPRDAVPPFGGLVNGASPFAHSRKGEFRIAGLPAGRYDLEVTPGERFPTVWVRDVAAGTEGLTVVLEGTRPARVTVEVTLSEGELAEALLLTGKLRPHGAPPDAPELPAQAAQTEPWGWPRHVLGHWSGGGGRTDELGWTNYTLAPMPFNPTTLELDEGLYWLGAKARAKDGNSAFPVGTGLVRVSAGEHRLRFELGPSGAVEGRVTGAQPDGDLFVALARKGELLELDVRRSEAAPVAELGHDGWFRFPFVPAGELELRVGTRAELLAGRWLRREELCVARGATLAVEVDL